MHLIISLHRLLFCSAGKLKFRLWSSMKHEPFTSDLAFACSPLASYAAYPSPSPAHTHHTAFSAPHKIMIL